MFFFCWVLLVFPEGIMSSALLAILGRLTARFLVTIMRYKWLHTTTQKSIQWNSSSLYETYKLLPQKKILIFVIVYIFSLVSGRYSFFSPYPLNHYFHHWFHWIFIYSPNMLLLLFLIRCNDIHRVTNNYPLSSFSGK